MALAPTTTAPAPIPPGTPQPNFGKLLIIVCRTRDSLLRVDHLRTAQDDVLYPKGQKPYTPFELHVRLALFVVGLLTSGHTV